MKRMELIRWAMQMTDQATDRIVSDVRDNALLQPMPGKGNGGNHAMWIIGHLAYIEGDIPKIILGESNPVERWQPLFGIGSQPRTDSRNKKPMGPTGSRPWGGRLLLSSQDDDREPTYPRAGLSENATR